MREGYLADLLIIDGDPIKDVTLLQDIDSILMVMKDGQFHRPMFPRRGAVETKVA